MGGKRKQLSHAEIWDDSALVQSWDDALAEYKLYHSIHARGERVEDVIKQAEAGAQDADLQGHDNLKDEISCQTDGAMSEELEEGELEEPATNEDVTTNYDSTERTQGFSSSMPELTSPPPKASHAEQHQAKPTLPEVVLSGDEALKNLMMSWYYAGYYTGLYEGQQQAQNTANK